MSAWSMTTTERQVSIREICKKARWFTFKVVLCFAIDLLCLGNVLDDVLNNHAVVYLEFTGEQMSHDTRPDNNKWRSSAYLGLSSRW